MSATLLLACGGPREADRPVGDHVATSVASAVFATSTPLPLEPPASTTTVVSSTTLVDAQGNLIIPTTTTLPPATADPVGVLRVSLDDAATAADAYPTVRLSYEVKVGSLVYVDVAVTNQKYLAGFRHPESTDRAVLAEVSDEEECPGQQTCVAFQALAAGVAVIGSEGVLPPDCACMPEYYEIHITVQ